MAINTVAVGGKVLTPAGVAAAGGRIVIDLVPAGGSVDDSGTEQVIAPQQLVVIGADGSVNFQLIPTDLIAAPLGGLSFYRATYDVNGVRWVHFWDGPLSTGADPIDIGDIEVTQVLGGLLVFPGPPLLSADPPLTEANRGRHWRVQLAGYPEMERVILKDADGNLTYVTVAQGG